MNISRGDIFYVNLGDGVGSEQKNKRPCVIIQNNIGNTYSPTTIIACITSSRLKKKLPTHVYVNAQDTKNCNGFFGGIILCEQIRTIDKTRLISKVAEIKEDKMKEINKALKISFDIKT